MTSDEHRHLHTVADEHEANALLAELERAGISAELARTPGGSGFGAVMVESTDLPRARRILRAWLGDGAARERASTSRASVIGWITVAVLVGSLGVNVWLAMRLRGAVVVVEGDRVVSRDAEGRRRAVFEYHHGSEQPFRTTTYDVEGREIGLAYDDDEDGTAERYVAPVAAGSCEYRDEDQNGRSELQTCASVAERSVRLEDGDDDGFYEIGEVREGRRARSRARDSDGDLIYDELVRLSDGAQLLDVDADGFYDRLRLPAGDGEPRTIELADL